MHDADDPDSTVLITGATGFVGQALCRHLLAAGYRVRATTRRIGTPLSPGVVVHPTEELGPHSDWKPALDGIDMVVHLAGRVHQMRNCSGEAELYHRANAQGTAKLAQDAAAMGVRRLIFASTIKVNGESTPAGRPFTEADPVSPVGDYARSKWEAEQALHEIVKESGLQAIALRLPLVYGPEVGANFRRLMDWVWSGLPTPLGLVRNSRSMLYLGNLLDAVAACLKAPDAPYRIYLLSDGQDISTPELIRTLSRELGRRAPMVPVPAALLGPLGRLLGKETMLRRLTDSLQVDSGRIQRELGWAPPFSLQDGLAVTAKWYRTLRQ